MSDHDPAPAKIHYATEPLPAPPEGACEVMSITVFREDDGRFAAEYTRDGGREAGMGRYSSTPIGALAELCATLIKVDEDNAKELTDELIDACRQWLTFLDQLPGDTEFGLVSGMALVSARTATVNAIAKAEGAQ